MEKFVALFILWSYSSICAYGVSFGFNEFGESQRSNFTFRGEASLQKKSLSLTKDEEYKVGRAYYSTPVQMKKQNQLTSFSTSFVFCIIAPKIPSGPGMAFVMSETMNISDSSSAQYLGLFNNATNPSPSNIFAVEFDTNRDTSQSGDFLDIDGNHVGVDLNSLISNASSTAGYWESTKKFVKVDLTDRRCVQAWIDYENSTNQLNISIAKAGDKMPQKPLISLTNFSLSEVIPRMAHVGFSSSTGSSTVIEQHYVLAWSFSTYGPAQPLELKNLHAFLSVNSFVTSNVFKAIVGLLATISLVVITCAVVYIKKKHTTVEEWEKQFWPQRISYRELEKATKGFDQSQLVGQGAFGRVYKGVLRNEEVAVKLIEESATGARDFVTEVTSIGRVKHRNLVPLRGWCRREKKLLIVYELMPNGSLHSWLHPKSQNANNPLTWWQRYEIIRGVASALVYLHEESKECIVHRDIKSSNVLLDAEMNGRLGDFGLAKLFVHGENPHTTRAVGTPGYMALEMLITGKATTASDVFSFGVLVLETVSGRRPIDVRHQASIVDWARKMYEESGSLVQGADPGMCGVFDGEMVERVMRIGLMCSCHKAKRRPTMRQVVRYLGGEGSEWDWHAPLPRYFYSPPSPRQYVIDVNTSSSSSSSQISQSVLSSTTVSVGSYPTLNR